MILRARKRDKDEDALSETCEPSAIRHQNTTPHTL